MERKMLDMLLNFIPEWICLYKTPMSPKGWHAWEKMRKLGSFLFIVLGTIFLGGSLVTCSLLWNILLRNRTLISFDFIFETCLWFSGAFVTVFIEWKLQESRFRLPPKKGSLL